MSDPEVNAGVDYATAAKRAFQFMTVDFWKSEESEPPPGEEQNFVVPLKVVVKFIMDHLKLENKEIVELRWLGGSMAAWKIKTKEDIIVNKRYKIAEFEDEVDGYIWKCSIRGGMRKPNDGGPLIKIRPPGATVKIISPPEEVQNHEIVKEILKFGDIASAIRPCTYRGIDNSNDHPFLMGILNGNKSVQVRIKPGMQAPKMILLRGKKVRIL